MTSPTVPRRRLGQELTRLRKAAAMTGEQVATKMEWSSPSKLYKIEGGRQGIQPKELRELLGYYGTTDPETVDALCALARQGKQRAWWSQYAEALTDSYTTYVGLESAATELRVYESTTVHGLLQTEDYARALLTTAAQAPEPAMSAATIDSKVAVRMERQSLLGRLRLWVILDEAALRRIVGGSEIMAAQYERLIEVTRLPSVKLQVLPLGDTTSPAPPTNFTVMEFDEGAGPDAVYVELLTGGIFVEGTDVRRYNVVFNNLRAAALSPARSTSLIKEVAAGLA
ncbi:helix-turn-helix domain-containing protein [Micromonospora echinofusca]|uniref:Helix-turn-helix domain-containing protein n=1 Tax=Micromonospora echinofusca TaxID=47858 RepID=A0ABS3VMR9_MICEH|nr:helix-turn-helix transcriptional regulator [Micromonospora echinofusca]MBO4205839.1 helix-turn-helix domain-containing protein [Micromonospora echinofusca]